MDTDIPSDLAQVIAVFIQAVFYGFYLITCTYCLSHLLRHHCGWRPVKAIEWRILIVTTVLWVLVTMNISFGVLRLVQAFVGSEPRARTATSELGNNWINVLKATLTNIQVIIADSVMVWRFWVVYQKSLVASIIPMLLWLGGVAVTGWTIYLHIETTTLFDSRVEILSTSIQPVCTVFWALTIALNIYTSGAIVLRIWQADRETQACLRTSQYNQGMQGSSALKSAMRIIIESGLIHSLVSVVVFLTQVLKSNSIYITTAVDVVVIGITFNLIILRVSSKRQQEGALGHGKESSVQFVTTPATYGTPRQVNNSQASIEIEDHMDLSRPSSRFFGPSLA